MAQDLGPTLLAIAWVFASVSIIVVAVRYYVRLRIIHRFDIADWIILFTLCLALCDSAFCTTSVHYGLGRHIQDLSDYQIENSIKWIYLCEFFSIMSPCFGRISYAFLLLNIIPPKKWRKRFLWSIIVIQFVVDVGTVIISFSQCQPIQRFWDSSVDGSCWDPKIQEYTGFFQGSVCSAVDLILAMFPASLFWSLEMAVKVKVSLSCLMGLGVFAMVASIVKTIELRAITEKSDITYAMAVLAIWWTLEAYLVLIAASIPTLKPLIKTKKAVRAQGSSSVQMNTYIRSQRPAQSANRRDPFFSLEENIIDGLVDNNHVSSYEAGAYTSEAASDEELRGGVDEELDDGEIRRDIVTSVTFEKAALKAEKGVPW